MRQKWYNQMHNQLFFKFSIKIDITICLTNVYKLNRIKYSLGSALF